MVRHGAEAVPFPTRHLWPRRWWGWEEEGGAHARARLCRTGRIGSSHCRREGVRLLHDGAPPRRTDEHIAPTVCTWSGVSHNARERVMATGARGGSRCAS